LIFDKEAVDFFSILNKIKITVLSKGGGESEAEMMKKKIVLASNLPRPAKPTNVVGAHMQKHCNCHSVPVRPEEQAEAKAKVA